MFGWLRKKEWRKSSAHLLLLSKFCKGDSPDKYRDSEDWQAVLKEKPLKAIERFLQEGVLEPAGLRQLVNHKFKASDLKSMAKESGLKVSGRKEELIERLLENNQHSMINATKGLVMYQCTAQGEQIAKHYLNGENTKRETAEQQVLDFLRSLKFSKALQVVADFEASQVFPRGLGIDWKNYDAESGVETLKSIFHSTPRILQRIEDERLRELRLAAAMMNLWGVNTSERWLSANFKTGIHIDSDSACRMFIFHAAHMRSMRNYKRAGIKTVEISAVGDARSCEACQKIDGKKYKLANVPELPYAKCTCDIGCRCTVLAGEFQ
jgi:hypothetical protein